jgi:hypothetical protein
VKASQRRKANRAPAAPLVRPGTIAKLDCKPGDTLVLTFPQRISMEQAAHLRSMLDKSIPHGVNVMALSGDVRLQIIPGKPADGLEQ